MNDIRISKYYQMGQFQDKQKSPRTIFVQVSDAIHNEAIMKAVYKLKEKKSPVRISQQLPEAKREHKIRLYEIQSQYAKKNITTVVKRDRLFFRTVQHTGTKRADDHKQTRYWWQTRTQRITPPVISSKITVTVSKLEPYR